MGAKLKSEAIKYSSKVYSANKMNTVEKASLTIYLCVYLKVLFVKAFTVFHFRQNFMTAC